jgi:hypothetical protein
MRRPSPAASGAAPKDGPITDLELLAAAYDIAKGKEVDSDG